MRHAHIQRRASAQEEPRQEHEGRTHRAAFHTRHRQPSGVAPLVSASAVQPTRDGGNGQGRGSTNTVHRRGLPLAVEPFLFNVTSTSGGSISQDIARPATTTTRNAARKKPRHHIHRPKQRAVFDAALVTCSWVKPISRSTSKVSLSTSATECSSTA